MLLHQELYTPAGTLANEKAFVDCGEVEGTRSMTWSDAVLIFASITLTELSVTNTSSLEFICALTVFVTSRLNPLTS